MSTAVATPVTAADAMAMAQLNAKHMDASWMIIAGAFVFFMQTGFCMLTAGCVRPKNVTSVLVKNLGDACVAAVCWVVCGYGIAFPDAGKAFMGDSNLMGQHKDFFFQWTFSAAAATIISGALAERARLEAYFLYTIVMCGFIYPMVVRMTWGGGFLYTEGYSDFAGSGIVHMTGGISAMVGAAILGPRIGKFDGTKPKSEFKPSSLANVVLGTFILWVGWYGFNPGSTLGMSADPADIAAGGETAYTSAGRCAMTTTMGAAAGGLVGLTVGSLMNKYYDIMAFCNGILGGLVSITAGTGSLDSWGAICAGGIGALIYLGSSMLLEKLKIDDTIGAGPVHGFCGAWGTIVVGLFDMNAGLFYGHGAKQLGVQLMGVGVIAGWCLGTGIILFGSLRLMGIFRVSAEVEEEGLDAECSERYEDEVQDPHKTKVAVDTQAP